MTNLVSLILHSSSTMLGFAPFTHPSAMFSGSQNTSSDAFYKNISAEQYGKSLPLFQALGPERNTGRKEEYLTTIVF